VWRLFHILNGCFRVVIEPLGRISPVLALLAISLFTGIVMLLIFRATSNQQAIKRIKDRIKAHLLEILLYNDNLGMVFRAQGSVLLYSLKYVGLAIVPMAAIIVPVAIVLTQSSHFFEHKPPAPHESVALTVTLTQWVPDIAEKTSISVPAGLSVETPALRIPEKKQIVWRIGTREPGDFDVVIKTPAGTYTKQLRVADSRRWLSPARARLTFARAFLDAAEPPLDRDAPIDSIEVRYAPARMRIGPIEAHWLVHFFIFSMLFALIVKPVLKVEI
jgi:uncharacterized membrane protein (DUF106 family)